jgi:hypothetical protein
MRQILQPEVPRYQNVGASVGGTPLGPFLPGGTWVGPEKEAHMELSRRMSWALAALAAAIAWGPPTAFGQGRSNGGMARTPAQNGIIEGEALVPGAVANGGSVSSQPMSGYGTGWGGGAHLFWSAGATGAVLDVTVDVGAPAEYAVELYFTKAPDYGQVAVEIGGQPSPVMFDGYAPRVMAPRPTQAGRFALQAGSQTFAFKIVGKNPSSAGFRMGLDQIRLYPVGVIGGTAAVSQTAVQPPQTAAPTGPKIPAAGKKGPGGGGPSASDQQETPKQPGESCDSTCVGDVATVYRRADDGGCQAWFRFPCSPYGCDATLGLCHDHCVTDGYCAQGAGCDTVTSRCTSEGARCAGPFTVRMPDGADESCVPYKCVAGTCRTVCTNPYDCAPGYTCNIAAGTCVPSPQKK